ncbi:MAG TPA: prenyltransferase/squalene oxidase repeat-containing protein [Thermoanaerobaculia bacterium]|nr:prenyltransferase/squalene oxidase repeat-containing protein [Thermoanaerobaculia bacterium]
MLVAVLACVALPALLPRAAAEDAAARATLDRGIRFLQDSQNADGGFGAVRGSASSPVISAWAAYALAAAGINPQDQARPDGTDVLSYLTARTAGLRETTDFARVALVAIAAGTSPRSFGPVDPLGEILSRQLPDGSFSQPPGSREGWINSTVWAIFPLSAIGTAGTDAAARRAAEWLIDHQRADGSWGSITPDSAADTDVTGGAIQALNAAGLHGTAAERRALEYLSQVQTADGGFPEAPGGTTNSATTAWVIQGLWAAGVDPRSWRTDAGGDPLSYLASLQRPDGSIGWTATSDLNALWMTAQTGPALAGRPYPLAAVPRQARAPRRQPPPEEVAAGRAPSRSERGNGGISLVRGDGVIAGGGGRGAPLYSAPQPQSGGSTPGGSRQIEAAPMPPEAASPQPGLEQGQGPDSGPKARAGRGTEHGGEIVEGVLVGGESPRNPAAPGLFSADGGGEADAALLIALLGGLGAAAAVGSRRERAGIGVG